MSRYIDADGIKYKESYLPFYHLSASKEDVDNVPTADVAPIVHAHWETICNDCGHYGFEKCSACGDEYGSLTYRYCPNCGARMDEEAKDDDRV